VMASNTGVRAFLLPEGSPGAGASPTPEPPGKFPTGYFDQPAKIEAWFKT